MIAILRKSAPREAVESLIPEFQDKGLETHVSHGENETIIGLVGDTTRIDPFLLESMDIVERVQRVSEPFKKANRKFHPADTVVDCGHGVEIGGGHFQVIAGPCSVEGDNLVRIARRVRAAGATMLRGGAYKPRTSPYAYQGMGPEGLSLLREAADELDMPIVTEIMDPRDVQTFIDHRIEVMQVGARNAQNFPLLKEVGRTRTPVLLKRGMSGTIDELLMAAEYIMSEGNDNVILCERGIRTFETRTRNTFDLNAVPVLHYLSHLPVVADPSHATGYTRYVEPMALAACAAGADGLEDRGARRPGARMVRWRPGTHARPVRPHDGAHPRHPIRRRPIRRRPRVGGEAMDNASRPTRTVGIVGLGLIGGSFARAYRDARVDRARPRRRRRHARHRADRRRVRAPDRRHDLILRPRHPRPTPGRASHGCARTRRRSGRPLARAPAPSSSTPPASRGPCAPRRSPWRSSTASTSSGPTPWREPRTPALRGRGPTCSAERPSSSCRPHATTCAA